MIEPKHLSCKRIALIFKKQNDTSYYRVSGRPAQALLWLIHRGDKGITAQEVSSWALRLSAYIHILRRDYKIIIITIREKHDGGIHGRYVLKDVIELVEIITPPEK